MNINRYNYEEFFLLYVDNELTKAERMEVEAFVDANPDLQEELETLMQLKLRPDAGLRFEGKELLMKPEQASLINETNYEEFFLLYIDNELDAVLRREVETFAASKPAYQQELALLMQTKAEPEQEIVFPDKSLLYKQPEKNRRPVVLMWRMMAVAAMLVLALGIFWLRESGKGPGDMASTGNSTQQKSSDDKSGNTPGVANNPDQQIAGQQAEKQLQQETEEQLANNQNTNTQNKNNSSVPVRKDPVRDDEPVNKQRDLAYEPNRQQGVEVTDRPVTTADVNIASNTANITISTAVETASLNTGVKAIGQPLVSYTQAGTSDLPEQDNNLYVANTSVSKKNKLRGLVRKVTRVIEKTANLPAVEEKGILIGGFEIALK